MKKIIILGIATIVFFTSTSFLHVADDDVYTILIDKSDRTITVFDETKKTVVEFKVVFGNNDMGDKMMEGDKKTPEGVFHVNDMRKHSKWNKFVSIDYPTKESYEKFNSRKAQGLIPKSAKIGGSIGIHGTWPNDDYMIDRGYNWTLGCISLKNKEMDQLYENTAVGDLVIIRK